MATIKGGLFIKEVKKLVRKYSKHIDAPVSIDISVWLHPKNHMRDKDEFHTIMKLWNSKEAMHYEPIGNHEDLRKMEALVNQLIEEDKKFKVK